MHKIIESIELHDTLNPKIWIGYELRDEVKEKLNEIVDRFILELHENNIPVKVLDARLVGSNASFNYTKNSDLDIHIIANFEDTSCDVPVLNLLYNFFKKNFNDKYDISIHGVPVELYVEDMNSSAVSNGVYSMFKDEWVKMPEPIEIPDIDITDEFTVYEDKYNKVIENNNAEMASDLVDELYLLRKDSISTDGEYGVGNLVFKEFRNRGYLDNLKQLMVDETSKELSLEHLNESKADEQKLIDFVGEETAKQYLKLKPRMEQPFNDLYWWIKEGSPQELKDYVDWLTKTKSKSQVEREAKQGAKLLYNKNGWKIYRIDTYEAATYYGKNTKWCISGNYPGSEGQGQTYFDDYKNSGVIDYYFIISPDNHKWCYLHTEDGFGDSVLWNEVDDGITDIHDDIIPNFPKDAIDVLPGFKKRVLSTDYLNILKETIIKNKTLIYDAESKDALITYNYHNMPNWIIDSVEHLIVKGGLHGVKEIKDFSFTNFVNLKDVMIEEGVTHIGKAAFYNCISLTKVHIPNTVINILRHAFFGCKSLMSIYIPKTVKFIARSVFMHCNDSLLIYCGSTKEFANTHYDDDWNLKKIGTTKDSLKNTYINCLYNIKRSNLHESLNTKLSVDSNNKTIHRIQKNNVLTEEHKSIYWIKQQFSDAFLSYTPSKSLLKAKLDNITDGEWEDVLDFVNSLEFPLIIYRGLKLNDISELNTSELGVNWTIDDELFFAPESAFYDSNYIIVTKITEDAIDYPETIQNYIYYSLRPQEGRWAESEITVKKGFKPNKYYILKKENDELVPIN